MKDEQAVSGERSQEVPARLQELVRKRHLRYEVWPEWLIVRGQRVKVGFNLQLFAGHDHDAGQVSPGCEKCREVFDDMLQVADWIIPKEVRASTYEIEPFERVWEESPSEGLVPEVPLTIRIVHRHGFDLPVDECEDRCVREMTGKLELLGVRKGKRPAEGSVRTHR